MFPGMAGDHIKLRTTDTKWPDILGSHIGGRRHPEGQDSAFEITAELRDIRIVSIQDRGAIRGQGLDQLIFGARDAGDRLEIFQMYRGNVSDDADFRLRDFRQRTNFSGMRHAHFDYGYLVLRFELKQHKRQTEMIVEVALRLQHTKARAEYVRNGFLGCGLASGSGHSYKWLAPDFSHRFRPDL